MKKFLSIMSKLKTYYHFKFDFQIDIVYSNEKVFLHHVKIKNLLSFQIWFPNCGPTYRRQVANQRHQTPQGQPIEKSGTLM